MTNTFPFPPRKYTGLYTPRPAPPEGQGDKARAYFSQRLTCYYVLTGVNRWPFFTNCN